MESTLDVENPRKSLPAALGRAGFDLFLGTPCGILAPCYAVLADGFGMRTITREDNAVGIAAGAAMAGRNPVVLMQNSGLGQSVNVLASLVVPYRIPVLLVIGVRGIVPDRTQENLAMGTLTEPVLDGLGIPAERLVADRIPEQVARAGDLVMAQGRPAALLVPPELFGWRP